MKTNWKTLRNLRLMRGLTQEQLAKLAKLSLRTVKESEKKGGGTIGASSIRQLALAHNVNVVELLADFEGLSAEHEIPRFLLQQVFPSATHDVLAVLRDGAIADMKHDFATARSRFEEALRTIAADDLDSKAQLIIRCATALDNNESSAEALALLRPLLEEKQWSRMKPWILKWLKYHIALAHRRIAESLKIPDAERDINLDVAEKFFKEVEATGEPIQRIAATHQLGCVLWVRAVKTQSERQRGKLLRQAKHCFEEALTKWRKSGNFREGYSLKRLAEIAEMQGERMQAHRYLLDALEVFVRHDCYRYRNEVRVHLERVFREMHEGIDSRERRLPPDYSNLPLRNGSEYRKNET